MVGLRVETKVIQPTGLLLSFHMYPLFGPLPLSTKRVKSPHLYGCERTYHLMKLLLKLFLFFFAHFLHAQVPPDAIYTTAQHTSAWLGSTHLLHSSFPTSHTQVVAPSIEGTRNVLSALDKSSTVKRLIQTRCQRC